MGKDSFSTGKLNDAVCPFWTGCASEGFVQVAVLGVLTTRIVYAIIEPHYGARLESCLRRAMPLHLSSTRALPLEMTIRGPQIAD